MNNDQLNWDNICSRSNTHWSLSIFDNSEKAMEAPTIFHYVQVLLRRFHSFILIRSNIVILMLMPGEYPIYRGHKIIDWENFPSIYRYYLFTSLNPYYVTPINGETWLFFLSHEWRMNNHNAQIELFPEFIDPFCSKRVDVISYMNGGWIIIMLK